MLASAALHVVPKLADQPTSTILSVVPGDHGTVAAAVPLMGDSLPADAELCASSPVSDHDSNADKVAVEPDAQILAQASSSQSSAQEQQLLNQIDTDVGKLKADEAAEQGQQKPINPDVKWLRATAYHLAEAAHTLMQTTGKYAGHRQDALTAMQQSYRQIVYCYKMAKNP